MHLESETTTAAIDRTRENADGGSARPSVVIEAATSVPRAVARESRRWIE